jgi:hypothetical protein
MCIFDHGLWYFMIQASFNIHHASVEGSGDHCALRKNLGSALDAETRYKMPREDMSRYFGIKVGAFWDRIHQAFFAPRNRPFDTNLFQSIGIGLHNFNR